MLLVICGNGVGNAELLRDYQAGIAQHRKWERMLLQQQIILVQGLWRDGDEQRATFAQLHIEVVPGL